jgi:hypothetical protein
MATKKVCRIFLRNGGAYQKNKCIGLTDGLLKPQGEVAFNFDESQ